MVGISLSGKYVINVRIEVHGIVEKADIVGAVFGQTEGLLGEELDMRELQKSGRLGRIDVKTERTGNKTIGFIRIPSNLDRVETALIAAAIETVDRVGPYHARVEVLNIEDVRVEKRKRIIERAKELLKKLESTTPESRELMEEVLKSIRAAELRSYGPEKLPAGPDVSRSDTIIVVEGRADVINLLKHGYGNVIALEGAGSQIPKTITELSKRKNVILFVDGDRGGELIIRNVLGSVDVDYIARAPQGREVEELTGKEIAKALRNKLPAEEYLETLTKEKRTVKRVQQAKPQIKGEEVKVDLIEGFNIPDEVKEEVGKLKGTLEAIIYDENWKPIEKLAVKDLVNRLQNIENANYVMFDGIITQRIVDAAFKSGVKLVIGARIGDATRIPEEVKITTFNEILRENRS